MRYILVVASLTAALAWGCCCGTKEESQTIQASAAADASPDETPSEAVSSSASAATAAQGGWGTIKGQIVFDGDKLPETAKLDVNKDQDHCLAKGPLHSEAWVVNPKNKGVHWVVAFLKPDAGKSLPVHESLKNPTGDAVIDQPQCAFMPHVLAMRQDQKLLINNPAPVVHTATVKGFKNDFNVTLAAGENRKFQVEAERNAVAVTCGIHPWMKGFLWVFEHPYFAVTDADGRFEIKLAPAGAQKLVLWQESMGYVGGRAGRDGRPVEVKPDGVTDIGVIKIKPTE